MLWLQRSCAELEDPLLPQATASARGKANKADDPNDSSDRHNPNDDDNSELLIDHLPFVDGGIYRTSPRPELCLRSRHRRIGIVSGSFFEANVALSIESGFPGSGVSRRLE